MENSSVLITSKYCSLKYETSWNGWKVLQKSSIFFFSFLNLFTLNKALTLSWEYYFCLPLFEAFYALGTFLNFSSFLMYNFFFDLLFVVSKMLI